MHLKVLPALISLVSCITACGLTAEQAFLGPRVSGNDKPQIITKADLALAKRRKSVIKIVERYGPCRSDPSRTCLWSRSRVVIHKARRLNKRLHRFHERHVEANLVRGRPFRRRVRSTLRRVREHLKEKLDEAKQNFNMLKQSKREIRQLKGNMEKILIMHDRINLQPSPEAKENAMIIAHIDTLLHQHQLEREQRHQKICHDQLAHFLTDVRQLIIKMRNRQVGMEQSLQDWIRMSYKQRSVLLKALRNAQERDLQRCQKVKALHDLYQRKARSLDYRTRVRLEKIIEGLQTHERLYQAKLTARLESIKNATVRVSQQENHSKSQLQAVSQLQKHLLDLSTKHLRFNRYLDDLITKSLLPGQRNSISLQRQNGAYLKFLSKKPCKCQVKVPEPKVIVKKIKVPYPIAVPKPKIIIKRVNVPTLPLKPQVIIKKVKIPTIPPKPQVIIKRVRVPVPVRVPGRTPKPQVIIKKIKVPVPVRVPGKPAKPQVIIKKVPIPVPVRENFNSTGFAWKGEMIKDLRQGSPLQQEYRLHGNYKYEDVDDNQLGTNGRMQEYDTRSTEMNNHQARIVDNDASSSHDRHVEQTNQKIRKRLIKTLKKACQNATCTDCKGEDSD